MIPTTTDVASSVSTEETTFVTPEGTTEKDDMPDLVTTTQKGTPEDMEAVTDATMEGTTVDLIVDETTAGDDPETTTRKVDEGAIDSTPDDVISSSTEGSTKVTPICSPWPTDVSSTTSPTVVIPSSVTV